MHFDISIDRETDGRWIAVIEALPGVLAYGETRRDAEINVKVLALRVLADSLERERRTADRVEFAFA